MRGKRRICSTATTAPTDDWLIGSRNALLAAAPLAVLLTFAVARALDQYPIAGPLPTSWFRRIGWDVSYGVPLATIGLVLVGYAIRDRSSRFAFAAGLLVNAVATIVVLDAALPAAAACWMLRHGLPSRK